MVCFLSLNYDCLWVGIILVASSLLRIWIWLVLSWVDVLNWGILLFQAVFRKRRAIPVWKRDLDLKIFILPQLIIIITLK